MKYQPYAKYKPSGIAWLGDVPAHWDVKRLKTSARYCVSNVDKVAAEGELPVRLCNYTDVYYHDRIHPDMALMETTATLEEIRRFGLRVGDVIVTKDSEEWSDIAIPALVVKTSADLVCGYHLAIIRPEPKRLLGVFLLRAFQACAINQQLQVAATGVTRYGLPKSSIGEAVLPIPPLEEQVAIADSLDATTAMLDKLVANKRELIDRLIERGTALISRTVTRGLPPEAARAAGLNTKPRLKPSGIEWLGDIPEHWRVTPTKYVAVAGTRNGIYKPPSDFVEDGVPMVQMSEAFAGPIFATVAKDRVRLSRTELSDWALLEGDLLFGRRSLVFSGSGKCVLVGQLPEPHVFESSLIRVRPNRRIAEPKYLFYFLGSPYGRAQVLSATKQVTISGVDSQQIKAVLLALPPLLEQRTIVDYLDRELAKKDQMVAKVGSAIERLQEYRSALITAAVTGKIDVREAAAKL